MVGKRGETMVWSSAREKHRQQDADMMLNDRAVIERRCGAGCRILVWFLELTSFMARTMRRSLPGNSTASPCEGGCEVSVRRSAQAGGITDRPPLIARPPPAWLRLLAAAPSPRPCLDRHEIAQHAHHHAP